MKRIWLLLFTFLLVAALLLPIIYIHYGIEKEPREGFFFGVSFGLKTAREAKLLIDKVKDYTNFFVVNSWDISINETALDEVCDYAVEAGLSFIVFFDLISLVSEDVYPWHGEWVATAKDRWGDKFLGIYIYEEPGGKQIDTGLFDEPIMWASDIFENASTYSEAAEIFVTELPRGLDFQHLQNNSIPTFTSDYVLYWFDYLAGYDTIFVELGWNHSTTQHIGLCRGAAAAQGKDWGAIITWTYINPPYLVSGPEILKEMLRAYEAGAKYVVVFNFPKNPETNPYGILTEEHFAAMRQFWKHTHLYPKDHGEIKGEVVFVLPKDYGWGMRNPNDLIWGLWSADNRSSVIWENMNKLIEKYGLQLDIVYDDPRFNLEKYSKVYFWNVTIN
jgi:hypothetical protein